jgi:hypothetical protein
VPGPLFITVTGNALCLDLLATPCAWTFSPMLRSSHGSDPTADRFQFFTLTLPRIRSYRGSFLIFHFLDTVVCFHGSISSKGNHLPFFIHWPLRCRPFKAVHHLWGSQDLEQYHRRTSTGIFDPIGNSYQKFNLSVRRIRSLRRAIFRFRIRFLGPRA